MCSEVSIKLNNGMLLVLGRVCLFSHHFYGLHITRGQFWWCHNVTESEGHSLRLPGRCGQRLCVFVSSFIFGKKPVIVCGWWLFFFFIKMFVLLYAPFFPTHLFYCFMMVSLTALNFHNLILLHVSGCISASIALRPSNNKHTHTHKDR